MWLGLVRVLRGDLVCTGVLGVSVGSGYFSWHGEGGLMVYYFVRLFSMGGGHLVLSLSGVVSLILWLYGVYYGYTGFYYSLLLMVHWL